MAVSGLVTSVSRWWRWRLVRGKRSGRGSPRGRGGLCGRRRRVGRGRVAVVAPAASAAGKDVVHPHGAPDHLGGFGDRLLYALTNLRTPTPPTVSFTVAALGCYCLLTATERDFSLLATAAANIVLVPSLAYTHTAPLRRRRHRPPPPP